MFDVLSILSDGQWHARSELITVAGSGAELDEVIKNHPWLAESDTGRWFCLPDARTPTLAPDDLWDLMTRRRFKGPSDQIPVTPSVAIPDNSLLHIA